MSVGSARRSGGATLESDSEYKVEDGSHHRAMSKVINGHHTMIPKRMSLALLLTSKRVPYVQVQVSPSDLPAV